MCPHLLSLSLSPNVYVLLHLHISPVNYETTSLIHDLRKTMRVSEEMFQDKSNSSSAHTKTSAPIHSDRHLDFRLLAAGLGTWA